MQTEEDPLSLRRLNAKIGILERRVEHLRGRIDDPSRRDSSKDFDRSECAALEAAVQALRYHSLSLDPATNPALVLQELVDSLDEQRKSTGKLAVAAVMTARTLAAVDRARKVLAVLGDDD